MNPIRYLLLRRRVKANLRLAMEQPTEQARVAARLIDLRDDPDHPDHPDQTAVSGLSPITH